MKLLLLALALVSTSAHADPVLSVGIGKASFYHNGTPFERSVVLGYQHNIREGFFVRPEAGYFLDISGNGKSSLWGAALAGVTAKSKTGPELHIGFGPGYLQNPDPLLGGHFQFSLEGGVGISGQDVYLGLIWKHLSSAGINMPNQGRDFIMAQLRILIPRPAPRHNDSTTIP